MAGVPSPESHRSLDCIPALSPVTGSQHRCSGSRSREAGGDLARSKTRKAHLIAVLSDSGWGERWLNVCAPLFLSGITESAGRYPEPPGELYERRRAQRARVNAAEDAIVWFCGPATSLLSPTSQQSVGVLSQLSSDCGPFHMQHSLVAMSGNQSAAMAARG